ncbi:MAG: DGQHR domain-containing protein [Spirochaetes bacterium]|nr:DGQHR domain-containing protein [Spirochaetota bacterium]
MSKDIPSIITIPVVRSKMLGVSVYRGFAELSLLSDISKADIYDQKNNPIGTQRDLSISHAKDAYIYIKTKNFGFCPEVFLCARENQVLTFKPLSDEITELGILEIDTSYYKDQKQIIISRIDGNHRLHFANGNQTGYSRINKIVSFCLAIDLSIEEEIQLFKDINKNQKPMNTSHLDNIEIRLTPEEELKKRNPDLFIAQQLNIDDKSPFKNIIYEGGKKPVGVDIPLKGLRTGIQYMLSRSTQLLRLPDAIAQYKVIKNYFNAVKKWQPQAWDNPKEHIMLRGAGLWAICFLGAQVIDRTLLQDKYSTEHMLQILKSGKEWDWSKKGDFIGRGGALEISNRIARLLKDDNHMSTSQLFDQIMADDS